MPRHFEGLKCRNRFNLSKIINPVGLLDPEVEGDTFFRNVGKH